MGAGGHDDFGNGLAVPDDFQRAGAYRQRQETG